LNEARALGSVWIATSTTNAPERPSLSQRNAPLTPTGRLRLAWWGPEVIGPVPLPDEARVALRDPGVRREFGWPAVRAICR
jgi:hypothetical protein